MLACLTLKPWLDGRGELQDARSALNHFDLLPRRPCARRILMLSLYRKSGILSGQHFAATGMNQFLLARLDAGWKIAAVTWDDEREGFVPPRSIAVARQPVAQIDMSTFGR